jgi:hypothetical protein
MHRQIRALTILDGLIQNAGTRFQRTFADEPLLERLRLLPRDDMVDPDVRAKCNALYRQWAVAYKNTSGLEQIATLYKQLPQTKRRQPAQSRVVRETEEEAERENSPPEISPSPNRSSRSGSSAGWQPQRPPVQLQSTGSSGSSFFRSSKDKKNRGKPFNLEKEKGQMLETIASANVASTNLINALKLINRENQRVSDNPECRNRFEICKGLRRQILRYIQLVESEQYIGGLLAANDELVKALMTYEFMDKSIDDDSDSDPEYQIGKAAFQRKVSGTTDTEEALAGLSIDSAVAPPKPPRPTSIPMPPPAFKKPTAKTESEPEEDEDDPFGDSHVADTPYRERDGMTW